MKNIFLVSLLMLAALVGAQTLESSPYIEVSGQSERSVTPDEIFLSVVVSADKASDFRRLNTRTMEELSDLGITREDITLADAQGEEVSAWFREGYETTRMLLVKVATAKMVNAVIENMRDIGIDGVNIVRVDYSKKEELQNELRVEAMKNAKVKSQLMLAAIDAQLGAPLLVKDNSWASHAVNDNATLRRVKSSSTRTSMEYSTLEEIGFKDLKYRSEVTVRFAIK